MPTQSVSFKIPEPLTHEHEELHAELARATKVGGALGEAAKAVAKIMHGHFVREEEIAMPPLALLPALAEGKVTPEMAEVFAMTDALKAELPRMLEEHQEIVAALKKLRTAAEKEKKPEYARFAEKLIAHARTEELVLYPAAIVLGEYLKLKLGR